jgi:hypothetical protein
MGAYAWLLLESKKENTEYSPYLDLLPTKSKDFPILFDIDELSYLKGSPLLAHIKTIKKSLKQ